MLNIINGNYVAVAESTKETSKEVITTKPQKKKIEPLKLINGNDFLRKEFPPIEWIVKDFLPEGLGILSGDPKIGKSFLVLNFALRIASGEQVFERETRKSKVLLLLYEDKNKRLQNRIQKLGYQKYNNLSNLLIAEDIPLLKENGIETLRNILTEQREIKFVVIDTFGRAFPGSSNAKNQYQFDYDLLAPYQSLAEEMHVCILLVHHTTKMEHSNIFNKAAGSTAMQGAVDFLWILISKGNSFSERKEAELSITGKDLEESSHHLEFKNESCEWIESENQDQIYRTSPERQQIIDCFENDPGRVLQTKDIVSITGKKDSAVSRSLGELFNDGILTKTEYGKYKLKL